MIPHACVIKCLKIPISNAGQGGKKWKYPNLTAKNLIKQHPV